MIKQVIVVRQDLNMRVGKIAAQSAHAAMLFLVDRPARELNDLEQAWLARGMTKICLRVESDVELLDVMAAARAAGLTVHSVTDAGRTAFDGVPTLTCCAIGPNEADRIDRITGNLPLL